APRPVKRRLLIVGLVFAIPFGPLLVRLAGVVVGRMVGVFQRPEPPSAERAVIMLRAGDWGNAQKQLRFLKPERSRRGVAEALVECATHNSDVQTRIEALMAL